MNNINGLYEVLAEYASAEWAYAALCGQLLAPAERTASSAKVTPFLPK
jgi:hypothetical protein